MTFHEACNLRPAFGVTNEDWARDYERAVEIGGAWFKVMDDDKTADPSPLEDLPGTGWRAVRSGEWPMASAVELPPPLPRRV